jgi:hypothetical protein
MCAPRHHATVDRNAEQIDRTLERKRDLYMQLFAGRNALRIFLDYDATKNSPARVERQVSGVLDSYLLYEPDICSVQILHSQGVFYSVNTTHASVYNLEASEIYRRAKTEGDLPFWGADV